MAQDQATSVVWGMPKAAVELGAASRVLPVGRIAEALVSHLRTKTSA
ncbi:chemotaxis protein CheB [Singulisphaera rosea]